AAAAMIAIAIGVWVIGDGTQRAYAQPELAEIHHANARHGNDFRPCHDGKGIARRIGKHCGRRVAVPVLPGGCQYVGSTLATFRDRTVASAVIESDGQAISVITLRDEAASLGFSHRQQRDGQTVYLCGYEDCRMAALTVDGVTLVATGDMDHDQLIVLLQAFAAANASPAAD
ncbi:MAG: hypothetical protein KGY81_07530, partial [Phycisphaerae bacterium]|nr:hypothetical protein [Phycisphaerae bacterium]